jgi:hypothetical protein
VPVAGTFTTGIAALALGGIAAALTAAQPVEVSLLERPGPATPAAPLPATIDPPSVREAARAAGVAWFAATPRDRSRSVCLLSLGNDDRLVLHRCAPVARGLVAGARRDGRRLRVAGIVPDGITAVTIGRRTVAVRGNAFTITTRRRPDVVVLQGPAAPRIPRRQDVVVLTHVGDPPAVAVSFVPDLAAIAPLGPPGTLRAADAAMPFAVLAPVPPPRGAPLVRWAGGAPGVAPRVEIRYLRTSGPGITVTERAAAPGTPDRRPVVTRDMPDGAVVRTVLAGTLAEVRGRQDALDDLLAVAASLRPVVP